MLRYLKSVKSVQSATSKYVVGNQSADMDSCCSALAAAYLSNCSPDFASGSGSGSGFLPLINIPRKDLRLRPDIVWLFESLQINSDWLLFSDDVKLLPETGLFLVDHNSAVTPGAVEAIIDHHALEGEAIPANVNPDIIGKSGSCMSLIVDYFRSRVPAELWHDSVLPTLCLAPILQDTRNLQNKVEPVDVKSATFLESSQGFTTSALQMFETAKEKKKEIDSFSAQDLLNKDYKQWGNIGISSIPVKFSKVVKSHPDFWKAMVAWKQAKKLDVCIALASGTTKGVYGRELAIAEPDFDIAKKVPELDLELIKSDDGVELYNQRNTAATRKQVAPAVRALFETDA